MADKDVDIDLDHIDRFADLSDDEVKKIATTGTYVTVPKEWSLMGEGTSSDKAYLLISGEVSVRQHGKQIAKLGPGDIFGEMGIVQHKLRSASVISLTRLECLHFTREQIEQLEQEIPKFREVLEYTTETRSHHD
jgi:CRP/FNR family transcriptional regulator, cyclic AMP receptor protein